MNNPGIDPITVEIIRCALDNIADEVGIAMTRCAKNVNFSEAHDYSAGIFDYQGRIATLSTIEAIPIHMGAAKFSVKAALEYFGIDDLHPGDVIVLNDPYYGGSHLPDWTVMTPVFFEGELVLFPSVRAHQEDTGGMIPGSYNPNATDIWQEGLRLSPIKIYDRGTPRQDIIRMLEINSRSQSFPGDLQAMVGATRVGEKRIVELLKKYGKEQVKECLEVIYDYTERLFRAEIARWPDGTYYGESRIEHDGHGTEDVTVRARVTIRGEEITIDLSDSDPQVRGTVNSPLPNTYTYIFIAFASMIDESIPKNEGLFRPLTVIAPEGTVVNPREPAPVTECTVHVGGEVAEAIAFALEKVVPQRAYSQKIPMATPVILYGTDPRTGKFFSDHNLDTFGGGCRAAWNTDGWGLHPSIFGPINLYNTETCELSFPSMTVGWEYLPDTAGAGKWRGTCAVYSKKVVRSPQTANFIALGTRYPSRGFNGGRDGRPARFIFRQGSEDEVVIDRFCDRQPILPEQVWYQENPSGGGWGNPFERDPGRVREDVLDEVVSIEGARRDYGVVIDPDSREIDEEATESLRKD